jgi:hypothetical protein
MCSVWLWIIMLTSIYMSCVILNVFSVWFCIMLTSIYMSCVILDLFSVVVSAYRYLVVWFSWSCKVICFIMFVLTDFGWF